MRICGARELVRTLGTIAQEVGNAELGGDAGSLGQRTAVDQSDRLGKLAQALAVERFVDWCHRTQFVLMPAAAMTCRQRSLSCLINAAVSAGELPIGVR